jgi:Lon protease-like protein
VILAERYKTPADLPREIAVFPLQGAILLPRSALPLNVFEPRYLQMLDDVISGSRILGIIQPAVSDSPSESPLGKSTSLRTIGCAKLVGPASARRAVSGCNAPSVASPAPPRPACRTPP